MPDFWCSFLLDYKNSTAAPILRGRRVSRLAGNREAAAADGLGEVFIEVGIQALEGGGVEPVADDAGVAENVSACVQLLGVQPQHFFFQRVADGVRLCLGFACQLVVIVHGFNQAHDFILAHCLVPLLDGNLFGGYLYQLSTLYTKLSAYSIRNMHKDRCLFL